jgi:hypothetical protein
VETTLRSQRSKNFLHGASRFFSCPLSDVLIRQKRFVNLWMSNLVLQLSRYIFILQQNNFRIWLTPFFNRHLMQLVRYLFLSATKQLLNLTDSTLQLSFNATNQIHFILQLNIKSFTIKIITLLRNTLTTNNTDKCDNYKWNVRQGA